MAHKSIFESLIHYYEIGREVKREILYNWQESLIDSNLYMGNNVCEITLGMNARPRLKSIFKIANEWLKKHYLDDKYWLVDGTELDMSSIIEDMKNYIRYKMSNRHIYEKTTN